MLPLRKIVSGLSPISGQLISNLKVNVTDIVRASYAGHDNLVSIFVCRQQRRGYRSPDHIGEISMKDACKILAEQVEYCQHDTGVPVIQGREADGNKNNEHVARKGHLGGSSRNGNMLSLPGFYHSKLATSHRLSTISPSLIITPYRYFTTTSVKDSYNYQGVQAQQESSDFTIEPCPQGIQGDECIRYKLWKENCQRYGLPNCDEQLQGIQSGRRTLAEVLSEQEHLIREIAENYREKAREANQVYIQGVQGQFSTDFPNVTAPCPQGVQGDDCVRFKLWLENCHRFGFQECEDQLQGIQRGRKTLAQVFSEQNEMIIQAVEQHRKKAGSSEPEGEVGNKVESNSTPNIPPSQPPNQKLSQRERLKRAVKEYGSIVIIFHIGISLISLGSFYLAVSSGLDVIGLLSKIGVGESIMQSQLATGASTFVVAYAVHKVFAPARIAITLTSTAFIVRYLRKVGFLKPSGVKKL